MADDEQARPPNGDLLIHMPMPYIVKLRVSGGDDTTARTIEWKGYAYSLMEAQSSALAMVSAAPLPSEELRNIKTEDIGPDLPQYAEDFGLPQFAKAAARIAKAMGVKL